MNVDDYTRAFLPAPVRILDVKLRPFCIGHALLLQRFGSPYADKPEEERRETHGGHLIFACVVCSRSYERARDLIFSKRLGWVMRRWGWLVRWRWPHPTWMLEEVRFLEYVSQARSGPKVWPKDEGAKPLGSPFLAMLITRLHRLGYSESGLLNVPLGGAIWHVFSDAEREGSVKVWSQADQEFTEYARAEAAKHGRDLLKNLPAVKKT